MLPGYTGTFFAFLALNSHHNIASMSQFSRHLTVYDTYTYCGSYMLYNPPFLH